MTTFWAENDVALGEVPLVVINLPAYASSVEKITDKTDAPVLQDTTSMNAATQYGAAKWYLYVIRPDGALHIMHYNLPMEEQIQRLLQWIADASAVSP